MGQSTSKSVGKATQSMARKVAEVSSHQSAPPLPPKRNPAPSPHSAPPSSSSTPPISEASNPANFLRGEGIAKEDIRDKGQQLYLQQLHKVDDETLAKGEMEMPPDLLKFLQDAGPAKQDVDREFTAPRLLEKENEKQLHVAESGRTAQRMRIQMPLMGSDQSYTTTKNTNFSRQSHPTSGGAVVKQEFGMSYLELFQFLHKVQSSKDQSGSPYGNNKTADTDFTTPETVYTSWLSSQEDPSLYTDKERERYISLMKQTLEFVEIPVLRRDADGNVLGLYSKDVPGPEVVAVQPIPENKIKWVLQDINDMEQDLQGSDNRATANLEKRRQARKQNTRPAIHANK